MRISLLEISLLQFSKTFPKYLAKYRIFRFISNNLSQIFGSYNISSVPKEARTLCFCFTNLLFFEQPAQM